MKKFFVFVIFLLGFAIFASFAQSTITYNGDRNYKLVERTDLRRYDNGKYRGLISREICSFISRENPDNAFGQDFLYDGNFFITEQTVSSSKQVFKGVHTSIPSTFKISQDGKLTMIVDNGYPSFRSFPSFPKEKISVGYSWRSSAIRTVDPLHKGIVTKLPMEIEYVFDGEEVYKGIPVYKITAKWATRYGKFYKDFGGDLDLQSATGSHRANILVSKKTGSTILIHDIVDESFTYSDGLVLQLKGTISQFTEYPPSVDYRVLLPALQRIAKVETIDGAVADVANGAIVEVGTDSVDGLGSRDKVSGSGVVASVATSSGTIGSKNGTDATGASGTGTSRASFGGITATGTNGASTSTGAKNGTAGANGLTVEVGTDSVDGLGSRDKVSGSGVVASVATSSGTIGSKNGTDATGASGTGTSRASFGGISATGTNGASTSTGADVVKNSTTRISNGNSSTSYGANSEKIQSEKIAPYEFSFAKNDSAKKNTVQAEKVELDDIKNSMVVEETPAGLRLSVRDIRFLPDSDEVLPEELYRLDKIAEVLRLVPQSYFLIEGHSASVGNPKGEQNVSELRAKAIAKLLSKRGIPEDHFICKGYGATMPISKNDTASEKAKNRRVEITILE